ncbi:MAG: type IV secretory system conjugative DNA transfer family protein [Alphaproteobacteria bacterium]
MRVIQNFVIIATIAVSVILGCFYISSILMTYFINGAQYVRFDPIYNLNMLIYYSHYWWINKYLFQYNINNSFLIKYFATLLGPITISLAIFYKYKTKILTWRPYKKKESVHGDARWATEEDVKKAGLRDKTGMLLGKDRNGYYVVGGFQHALLFAPTGSGKGVGFVIPNLLFWQDSVIVHDIKLENYQLTSGWRAKQKQKVFIWSPADPDGMTHCYNPIDWVSSKPGQMVDDVQKIANLILPEKEFWSNEARSLFVGVVLYLLAVPDKVKSFGEVVRTLRSDDVVYNLAVVLDTIGKMIHPVAYMNIAAFLQKADKERSGVVSTLNSALELWANPLIDTATASSDFNIQNFKKDRTTVYVGLTPDNIQRLQPLMQVFYQQATEFLSRKIPDAKEEPYGVMFMMDEFPTLGKMEQFKTGIAYFRGYNVRLFLIIQDTEQLKGTYEEAGMNSFLSNSTYRITFSANNMETANLISQLCGNKTVEQSSLNKPKFLDLNPASRSLHVSEVQRALLLPQEVILLPRDEQIVLIESFPPIKSKKIKYYEDRLFKRRLLPAVNIPKQEPYDPRNFVKAPPQQPVPEDKNEITDNSSDNDFETLEDNFDDADHDFFKLNEDTETNEVKDK